jgi:hypothetical protein
MGYTYILVIWTVVGGAGWSPITAKYDWRPVGEFHKDTWERKYTAKEMCEEGARQLGLKPENYRCVRSK